MTTSTSLNATLFAMSVLGVGVGCASKAPPIDAAQKPVAAEPSKEASKPTAYPTMAPIEAYLIDRDAEIALAKSAAPPAISDDASVMVLTRKGYEKVIEGKNGFVCLVDRAWQSDFDDAEFWNPKNRGPFCVNAPAVRSILPLEFRRTELALSGLSKDEILARMKDSIAKKEFGPPEVGSMSYMMSKDQYLGDQNPHWHPHLMFYMPGDMDPAAWGSNLPAGSAVYGGGRDLPGGGRMPWTIFFVPVPHWSDGTPAAEHSH
jgi:hypothetical protein